MIARTLVLIAALAAAAPAFAQPSSRAGTWEMYIGPEFTDGKNYTFEGGSTAKTDTGVGLNIGFDMGYTKLRDQINLKRGNATQQEVLLRLRQLATGYYYYGSINISYTFGSAFSNVVNPRFGQGGGGFFF